jgi:MYXO-CTERM domain-containing protein
VTFPSVKPQGVITPEIAQLFNDLVVNDASLAFFTGSFLSQLAAVHDASRNGGDTSSPLLMLAVTGGGLRDLYQQQAARYSALRAALAAAGFPDFPLPREGVSAFLDDFRINGFSVDQMAFLALLGLSPDGIASMGSALLRIDPSNGPTSFFSLLDGLAQTNEGIAAELGATPEPTTFLLWGTTMAGLGLAARWRRRNRKQKP